MNHDNWTNSPDPWDRDTYQTGSTTPPKNHGGLIAMLLALTICFSGMVSILALMKVPLFETPEDPTGDTSPLSIQTPKETDPPAIVRDPGTMHIDITNPSQIGSNSITINRSEQGVDNIPQAGGLSLQDI